jgi:hypothetical protein
MTPSATVYWRQRFIIDPVTGELTAEANHAAILALTDIERDHASTTEKTLLHQQARLRGKDA